MRIGRTLLLVSLTSLLTDVSTEMVYPVLPLFLVMQLGAAPWIVGLIEGIGESLASLVKLGSGYWSDRLSRRKPLAVGGYAGSTAGKVALYLAFAWPMVLVGRVVDRIGKGVRTAPRDALIAESVDRKFLGRAFGFHRTMDTIGATIGVLLAYLVYVFWINRHGGAAAAVDGSGVDYRPLFLISLIPAALGVLMLLGVREAPPSLKRKEAQPFPLRPSAFRALPVRLKLFLAVTFVFALGNSSNQFLFLRANSVGHPQETVILLYLVYNITYALGAYPAGFLSDRIGRKRLLVAGYAVYGLTYVGFALLPQPWMAWGLFAVYGLYIAMTEGVEKALVAELSPKDAKATVLGLHAAAVGIGLFPASLLAGGLWGWLGAPAPFWLGGGLGLLAAAALCKVL